MLLRLVGEGETESAIRRRVPVSEFDIDRDATVAAVLTRLTEDRLLTRDDGMIEIAHEALIREWPRLRGWLEDDATGRQLRNHLTQAAKQWAERGRDAGDLYRGARLSVTVDWAQAHDRELNALEREFLAQSRQASERDAERQRRTNRRLRGLLVGTATFLVVALVAGSLALVQRSRARHAQAAAEAEALRSDARRIGTLALTESNLDRSLLLAVAGVRLQDLTETRSDLLAVLQDTPAAFRFLRPSTSAISALAVSPDGRLLASGDSAGVVHLHDIRTWEPSGAAMRLDGSVSQQAMAFSPDGGKLGRRAHGPGNRVLNPSRLCISRDRLFACVGVLNGSQPTSASMPKRHRSSPRLDSIPPLALVCLVGSRARREDPAASPTRFEAEVASSRRAKRPQGASWTGLCCVGRSQGEVGPVRLGRCQITWASSANASARREADGTSVPRS